MNRRSFFGRLIGGAATVYAAEASAQQIKVDLSNDALRPEPYPANLAFASVMPICPRCGSVLMTDWPPGLIEPNPLAPLPVKCGGSNWDTGRRCGWTGVAPRAMRIP